MISEPIHIAYAIHVSDQKWDSALFAGVSATSLFKNTKSKVILHILTDDSLSNAHREKFQKLADEFHQEVNFYDMNSLCKKQLNDIAKNVSPIISNRYGLGTFYRFFLLDVLPLDVNRCIYLDADTVVNLDIKTLWEEDLSGKTIGAVTEYEACDGLEVYEQTIRDLYNRGIFARDIRVENLVSFADYFNAGVFLLELDELRKVNENLSDSCVKSLVNFKDCGFADQDALNVVFNKRYHSLPERYNTLVDQDVYAKKRKVIENRIYHYIVRGLKPNLYIPQFALFFSYYNQSPWYEEAYYYRWALKENEIVLKSLLAITGKKRVYYAPLHNKVELKHNIRLEDSECYIDSTNENSLEMLTKMMAEEKGKSCFVLITYDYLSLSKILIDKGFSEFDDFIDGRVFLLPSIDRH